MNSGQGHFSDNPLLRQFACPTSRFRLVQYPFLRHSIPPTVRISDKTAPPTTHSSDTSHFRHPTFPTSHKSDIPFLRQNKTHPFLRQNKNDWMHLGGGTYRGRYAHSGGRSLSEEMRRNGFDRKNHWYLAFPHLENCGKDQSRRHVYSEIQVWTCTRNGQRFSYSSMDARFGEKCFEKQTLLKQ